MENVQKHNICAKINTFDNLHSKHQTYLNLKDSFRDEKCEAQRARLPQQAFVSFTLRKEHTVDNIRA
jgi:hypothetical protein